MDISNAKRDSVQVEAGRWIDDIPGMDDLRLRVRGLTSPIVVSLRARKLRKLSRKDRNPDGTPTTAAEMQIFGEVLAEAVLLGWDKLTENKTPVSYDRELAFTYCTMPDFMPFADAVTWAANAVDRGNAEVTEDFSGNSPAPSHISSEAMAAE